MLEPFHRSDDGAFVLYEGDTLELLPQLPAQSVDLIFADPPYYLSNGGTTCQAGQRVAVHKGDWDRSTGIQSDHAFHLRWLRECQRLLKPSGSIWVSGTHHAIFSIGYAMQELGYHMLNTVTWTKTNAPPHLAGRMFAHSTETLIWAAPARGSKLLHTFHYHDMKDANGGKQMRDVWQNVWGEDELNVDGNGVLWAIPTAPKREKLQGKHPTQKPLRLLERIILACTNPDDVVLDPFSGSSTTGVAAIKHGCKYLGIEWDQQYLELGQRRVEALCVEPFAVSRI
ncbi:MAG: site-specific DNA-methyltransferase [Herpetosiphonaceae bacterium]|nr:site-specific DNA-methyltransferase [Herpetosiphonaceae bacterium]